MARKSHLGSSIKVEDLTDAFRAEVVRQFKLAMKQWKRRDGTPMVSPDIDLDTPLPEPPQPTGATLDRLRVLAAIEPGIEGNETLNKAHAIAARVGFTYSRTSYHLRRLCKARRVRKINNGRGSGWGAVYHRIGSRPPSPSDLRLASRLAARRRVLAAIKPGERVSTAQIAERTGLNHRTAFRRLNDLIKAGKVERIGKNQSARYKLPDE